MSIFLTPADGGGNNIEKFQDERDSDYGQRALQKSLFQGIET